MALNCKWICLLLFLGLVADGYGGGGGVKPTRHAEIHRAKSEIDSLLFKLTLDLDTARNKASMAHQMQLEAKGLTEIAKREISILSYIRHLLHELSKGALDEKPWESCRFARKASITLETGASALPVNYTAGVTGE